MEINNKIIILIIIGIIVLLWYTNNTKNDINRYKNIIDTYMNDNNKKSSLKKVRFDLSKNESKYQ